tara:strand:- start:2698 stop:2910 length:213 start_codon:yes stop_codon:yes gene_type:complete
MIIEYSVEDLRDYYNNYYDVNTNYIDDKYEIIENIISDNIDNLNVRSEILHYFPIYLTTMSVILSFYYYI